MLSQREAAEKKSILQKKKGKEEQINETDKELDDSNTN